MKRFQEVKQIKIEDRTYRVLKTTKDDLIVIRNGVIVHLAIAYVERLMTRGCAEVE